MSITIAITCSHCHSPKTIRNGKKSGGKQNYLCTRCGRQFISGHEPTCQGCRFWVINLVKIMLVQGMDVRDISAVLNMSVAKVIKALKSTKYRIKPKRTRYDRLEIDEFWTYVGDKKNNVWLVYAHQRESGGIAAFVRGNLKTAQKLRKRIKRQGISYERIAMDDWDSFLAAFAQDNYERGKRYTVGMEGDSRRLRRRIRRACERVTNFV